MEKRIVIIATAVSVLLAGCGSSSTGASNVSGPPTSGKLTRVNVGMGYFANVQFAPFYVAMARGYYRNAGLDVHFQYGIEPDLLRLASLGKFDFVNAGGDEVLTAAANGVNVRYVMTEYSRFPTAVFSLKSTGIHGPSGLRGHSVGLPGLYGASYTGLLALLQKAHVPRSAVSIKSIGFSQVDAVATHKVDAAVGYAMNEPIELRQEGKAVNEIDVYHYANVAGAGIAAGNGEIAHHPRVVRAFVAATLHGLRDTLKNPSQAFQISAQTVKEIRTQRAVQRAVLLRSIDFWQPEAGHPLGWVDPQIWRLTANELYAFKQIPHTVSASAYYTNSFLPAH